MTSGIGAQATWPCVVDDSSCCADCERDIDTRALGLPDARIAVFTHPLGGLSDQQIVDRGAKLYEAVHAQLTKVPATAAAPQTASLQRLIAPADPAELQAWFFERHSSDGFPVIAPTPNAVAKMVEGSRRRGEDLVGVVPPRNGVATIEQIAINAVMAGCRPQHMPVLVTAVEAMLEPRFNLDSTGRGRRLENTGQQ